MVLPFPQGDQQEAYQNEGWHLGRLDPQFHTLVEAGVTLLFPWYSDIVIASSARGTMVQK